MRRLLFAAALLFSAMPAYADVILTLGQSSSANTISATGGAAGTTWGGSDIAVTVTQIAPNGPATPFAAFLDVTASNTTGALLTGGVLVTQHFAGTFSVNSLADGTGTNYLSGTFSDGAITANGATGIAVFAPTGTFASDVITVLELPHSINFALTNVTPPVSLVACGALSCVDTGQTIGSFTAAVALNASAEVPEPATIALFGAGLLGFGLLRSRRRNPGELAA